MWNWIQRRERVPGRWRPVELTSVEFNLLEVLLREARRVVNARTAGQRRPEPEVYAI